MTLINSDQCDPLIKSLGKSLETEIKYVSIGITLEKNKDTDGSKKKKDKEKTIVVLFGKEKFFIFLEDFKEVKMQFDYLKIKTIYLDKMNQNVLLIHLDKDSIEEGQKIKGFYIFVKDRALFVKSLICYHSTYLMYIRGEVDELPVKEKDFEMELNPDSILRKGKTLIHNTPDGFIKKSKSGFEFFIKDSIISEKDDVYNINTTKKRWVSVPDSSKPVLEEITVNSQLIIDIKDKISLEHFQVSRDDIDIYFYANLSFVNSITFIDKIEKYWIISNQFYLKKFNLNLDKARWEGYKIECRTGGTRKDNIVYLYLRRKFIPPFFDTFVDIKIKLIEPYVENYIELSEDAQLIVETLADSLSFVEKNLGISEYQNLLTARLEGLLLDNDSLDFFYNNLRLTGLECYKYGLEYVFKILTLIEDAEKEKLSLVKNFFKSKLIFFYENYNKVHNLGEFNIGEYERFIKYNDSDSIIRNFEKIISNAGNQEYFSRHKPSWEVKIWRYLGYCLNGGISNDKLNLNDIIEIYKGLNGTLKYQIGIQLNYVLNLRIINYKNEKLEPRITTIINNFSTIKTVDFNYKIMSLYIRTGVLMSIQGIENELNYSLFIKYLLENYLTLELLKALADYLKCISVDFDSISDQNMRKGLNTIIPSLVKIYSNYKSCPIMIHLACRCLCILTCSESDKNNKIKLMQENVLEKISHYLDYPDEKLLFTSLKLLLNINSEIRSNISEILYKNSKLISKLTSVLEGSGIPGVVRSIRIVESVITIFLNLLRMQYITVREKMTCDENRIIFFHLLYYLKDPNELDELNTSFFFNIQKMIYELFDNLIRKNYEIKVYLTQELHILEFIDDKSRQYFDFVCALSRDPKFVRDKFKDSLDSFIKQIDAFLKFIFYYISNFSEGINKIKQNEESFLIKLILMIEMESKKKEILNKIMIGVLSIKHELYDKEDGIE